VKVEEVIAILLMEVLEGALVPMVLEEELVVVVGIPEGHLGIM
jgi:hypothetical protein